MEFQSLSGFQVRCNIYDPLAIHNRWIGFNPYRVFKFVATLLDFLRSIVSMMSFNPYRVFKFVATCLCEYRAQELRNSFNPYRVFKFVATH